MALSGTSQLKGKKGFPSRFLRDLVFSSRVTVLTWLLVSVFFLLVLQDQRVQHEHKQLIRSLKVYYDNKLAATLEGLQQKGEMSVELKFHVDKIMVSLEGAPVKLMPKSVTLTDNTTMKAIRVARNMQVHNVFVFPGLARS